MVLVYTKACNRQLQMFPYYKWFIVKSFVYKLSEEAFFFVYLMNCNVNLHKTFLKTFQVLKNPLQSTDTEDPSMKMKTNVSTESLTISMIVCCPW